MKKSVFYQHNWHFFNKFGLLRKFVIRLISFKQLSLKKKKSLNSQLSKQWPILFVHNEPEFFSTGVLIKRHVYSIPGETFLLILYETFYSSRRKLISRVQVLRMGKLNPQST